MCGEPDRFKRKGRIGNKHTLVDALITMLYSRHRSHTRVAPLGLML
jgi:hypothetical protein